MPSTSESALTDIRIHPTAIIEPGVIVGPGTAIWDNVHIRKRARLGRDCIVGEKTYVAYDVIIGDMVKINAGVYICAGVTIETGCMIAAHVVFTNDRHPRATDPELRALQASDPDENTLSTVVRRGTTIGANATIGPGIDIGEFAMIGMGAVVTRDVAPHTLVVGAPARSFGYVCRCGHPLEGFGSPVITDGICPRCDRRYQLRDSVLAAL
jgi:UDP-2-acetamido-3-amino-2,3-dideoxy-glucuronate N-acetyltransferase